MLRASRVTTSYQRHEYAFSQSLYSNIKECGLLSKIIIADFHPVFSWSLSLTTGKLVFRHENSLHGSDQITCETVRI
jgi:hypothetical protein